MGDALREPTATLPSPSRIWSDSKDLIVDPFFVAGPQDIGLGLRVNGVASARGGGLRPRCRGGRARGGDHRPVGLGDAGTDPIFQMLRTVPPLAWLPLALAAFRDSNPSAIFVIFITAFWPIIINTAVGIRNIPQDYRNVAQVLRLNPLEFFWKIMLPSAAPYIFTGLRIGVGLSWLAIVAAEMLTGGVASASSSGMRGTPRACPTSSSPWSISASWASSSTASSPAFPPSSPAARLRLEEDPMTQSPYLQLSQIGKTFTPRRGDHRSPERGFA